MRLVILLCVLACVCALPLLEHGTVEVSVSWSESSAAKPFEHFWKRCFGSGHALLGTRADWRSHLQRARNELGLSGVRMHGVLDDDMSVTPDGVNYYFYNVDQVYDYLMELGIRPVVELSFMPCALTSCNTNRSSCQMAFGGMGPGSYRGCIMPPTDFQAWGKLIQAFATHLVERYGLDEVSQWHFEVWNELWGMPYPSDYMPLYAAAAKAVKSVSPLLRVGGPATMQVQWIADFVSRTGNEIPIDFISTHLYPTDPNCTSDNAAGHDPDCFVKTVVEGASIADAAGLPFLLTEYKDGLQDGPHGDNNYAAAFIIRTIPLLHQLMPDNVRIFSWWTFTDIFEEGWMRAPPFYGGNPGYGLLTAQGVPKPAYRAFQMLAKAGQARMPVTVSDPTPDYPNSSTVSCLATTSSAAQFGSPGAAQLQLFASNFGPEKGASLSPWTPVSRSVEFKLDPAPKQDVTALLYRIDNSTNPYDLWVSWNKPQYLTQEQLDALNKESMMAEEQVTFPAGSGTLTIDMPPYSAYHIVFN